MCLSMASAQGEISPAYPDVEGLRDVRSQDIATSGGMVHALLVGQFTQRQGPAVAYVFSSDSGRTWSPPAFVNRPSGPPPVARAGDDARLAVSGHRIVAVWKSKGELPGQGEITVARSDDRGRTWVAGTNPAIGDSIRNQSEISVTADTAGRVHLAWLDDREEHGNTEGLRYAQSADCGLHWSPETTLDPTTCTCCWTRLVTLPDRSVGLLYRDSDHHDMRLMVMGPQTAAWKSKGSVGPFQWQFSGCPHCGGGLAASGKAGRMVLHSVVWTGKEGQAGLYYLRSEDGGSRWSEPFKIGGADARESDIAARQDGSVALAYLSARGAPVLLQASRDVGRHWSPPLAITAHGVNADHPRVVATPEGFRVFWTETREGGGKTWAMAAPSL